MAVGVYMPEKKKSGSLLGTLGTVAGGVAGAVGGGPMGALAGAQAGRMLGGVGDKVASGKQIGIDDAL
jgi:hypothetical protein